MATTKLRTPTAVYAVVGAGDLVVERIRAVQLEREMGQLQTQVRTFPTKAQAAAAERFNAVVSDVRALPEQMRILPLQAQARVQAGVSAALGQAGDTFVDLANRGERLVTRIRRQKSTQDTVEAASNVTSRAKATTTTAKKAARSTTASAKATRTTAQRAASAATRATTDAAKKIGD